MSFFAQHDASLTRLVHGRERLYYVAMVIVSLAIYAGLAYAAVSSPEATAGVGVAIMYMLLGSLAVFLLHGLTIGRIRGNAVRVTPRQFAKLYDVVREHAATIGMTRIPDVFVLESGGLLNAFATRFLGRDFVVIHSDVLALAEERGDAAVGFIVAHELAHVARGHLKHRWLTMPARLVPYLGTAYSRACEYTCDRFGAHCQPDGGVDGLLALAAGGKLFRSVDAREYARQVETEKGFWVNRAELMSSHPHLPKRVSALMKAGVAVPAYTPMRLGASVEPSTT